MTLIARKNVYIFSSTVFYTAVIASVGFSLGSSFGKWLLSSFRTRSTIAFGTKRNEEIVSVIQKLADEWKKASSPKYEKEIEQDIVDPNNIEVQFSDIGGMDELKRELWELAVFPFQHPKMYQHSKLLQQVLSGGILLYGPPGAGKTMLAKAIAKEASATFFAVKLSTIMNKWYGESNKLIAAIFSLARKKAPAIIFLDKLDTFLSVRGRDTNSVYNTVTAEFLTFLDGIATRHDKHQILVVGATNRPHAVDKAI